MLMASFAPTISRVSAASEIDSLQFAEFCHSGYGVVAETGPKSILDDDDRESASPALDCPYCALHDSPPLPPRMAARLPVGAVAAGPPPRFFTAPRPQFAWAPTRSRGPPRSA